MGEEIKGKRRAPRRLVFKRQRTKPVFTRTSIIALTLLLGAALLVALIFILIPENQFQNSPEIQRIKRIGVLRVAVRNDVEGFSIGGEGFEVELAKALCKRIFGDISPDLALELVPVTAYTALPKLVDGSADIAIAMQLRPADTQYFSTSAYFSEALRIICRIGDERTELGTQIIGYAADGVSKAAIENYCVAYGISLEAVGFASYPDLCLALRMGKVRFAVVPAHLADDVLTENETFSIHNTDIGKADYYAVTLSDTPAFAYLMDMVLDDLRESSELSALIKKYGIDAYAAPTVVE